MKIMSNIKKENIKRIILSGFLLSLTLFIFAFMFSTPVAKAAVSPPPPYSVVLPPTGPGVVPFGGRIQVRRICSARCGHVAGTLLLYVGPPVPAWVMYEPGLTILYPYRSLNVGNWVLGIYYPGTATVCWGARRDRYGDWYCYFNGWAWGKINIVGTSR